jgi:hypothetical protein
VPALLYFKSISIFLAGTLFGAVVFFMFVENDRQQLSEITAQTNLHNALRALEKQEETSYVQSVLVGTLIGMHSWPKYSKDDLRLVCEARDYLHSLSTQEYESIVGGAGIPILDSLFNEAGCEST